MLRLVSAIFCFLFLCVAVATPALAQTTATGSAKSAQDRLKELREKTNKELTLSQGGVNLRLKDLRDRMATREAFLKSQLTTLKNRVASETALLKDTLRAFKDQKKATIAARLSDNLNKINQRRVETYNLNLTKMTQLLTKLDTKLSEASGASTESSNSAIASAAASISKATDAVNVQSTMDYTVAATSEATLKADIKVLREKLFNDLKTLHALVVEARKATSNAISTVRSTLGGNN